MELVVNPNKRVGLVGSVLVHLLLLFLFLWTNLTYWVPTPKTEIAVSIDHGNNTNGSENGKVREGEPLNSPTPEIPVEPEAVSAAPTANKLITDESSDIAVNDGNAINQPTAEEIAAKKLRDEKIRKEAERLEKIRAEEAAEKARQEAFKNKLQGAWKGGTGDAASDGDGTGDGDMGSEFGYQGGKQGGSHGPPGEGLAGRNANFIPQSTYDSPEEGTVVVKIIVDRSGKVIQAVPGVSNGSLKTTTANPSLHTEAKKLAMKYKWSANPDAPVQQVGYIPFTFSKGR